MVWNVPRSLSLVTVAGLMSTQTTLTQAGSRLPVAIECSAVAIRSAKPTPWIACAHPVLGHQGVGDHFGQRSVVADRAGEHQVDARLTHSYMIPK